MSVKRKSKYRKELPRELYSYFVSATESLPSFSKFARGIGLTLEDLKAFRKKQEFDRAWRDCIEIRRDYLIDAALAKRADPSFVKYLLSEEMPLQKEGDTPNELSVCISVEDG